MQNTSSRLSSVAFSLLLAFGLSACSSGGDNSKNQLREVERSSIDIKKNESNNSKDSAAHLYTENRLGTQAEIDRIKAEAAKKTQETPKKEDKKEERKTEKIGSSEVTNKTEPQATSANVTRQIKAGLSKSFDNANSASYQYLNESAMLQKLSDTLKQDSSRCKNESGNNCVKSAQKGDVILSDYQSYSGYAVIREEANIDGPQNAYLAVVNTPTREKHLVVNAVYKGNAVYTTKNQTQYAGYTKNGYNADLTLEVKDGYVEGRITPKSSKNKPTPEAFITFNPSEIRVDEQGTLFQGEAVFNTKAPLSFKDVGANLNGIYQGRFAGANAEEVVGTFETHSTDKKQSVQGAFMGKK